MDINLTNYVGKIRHKLVLCFNNQFFTLNAKVSIVDLTNGPDIDVDVLQILKNEDPSRLKNISKETWDIIRS